MTIRCVPRVRWLALILATTSVASCGPSAADPTKDPARVAAGQQTFRYETFGDETKWTDTLQMQTVISTAVDPTTALSVGLKVDADRAAGRRRPGDPGRERRSHQPGDDDRASQARRRRRDRGTVTTAADGTDTLTRVGITCALCHSTVDNSFAPGIGARLDGQPNLDLNPGAIIALSPALSADQKAVFNSWGPGKYDPRYNLDGQNGPQVIPPAYGLDGIHAITVTGDGRTSRTGTATWP